MKSTNTSSYYHRISRRTLSCLRSASMIFAWNPPTPLRSFVACLQQRHEDEEEKNVKCLSDKDSGF